ncbi:MAG: low molecular weight protein-tyrosine-phosphatase [Bacteroidales bacterium]
MLNINIKERNIRIIFVCLGNICRSPSAEAVFKNIIQKRGISNLFEIDSAGLHGYHEGERADARMRRHASNRGIELTSISRPIKFSDIEYFDLVIGMDDSNISALRRLAGEKYRSKIFKMTDFRIDTTYTEVPDPYYGGDAGFELVLDILEDSCEGLLNQILNIS